MRTCSRIIPACAILLGVYIIACAPRPEPDDSGRITKCPDCRIERLEVLALPDTFGLEPGNENLARDSTGLFYLGPTKSQSIIVLDSSGRLVRTIGRSGRGPGEFQAIGRFAIADDTLYVVEMFTQQFSVLTLDGTFVRGGRLTPHQPMAFVALPGRRLAQSGQLLKDTGAAKDQPVHVFDTNGNRVLSVGVDGSATGAQAAGRYRLVAGASGGSLWVGQYERYVVQLWDETGRKVREITSSPTWFQSFPLSEYSRWDPASRVRPLPMLIGVFQPSGRELFVIARVADPAWKAPPVPAPGDTETKMPAIDQDRMYDMVVDVFDPESGELLTSKRFDDMSSYPVNMQGLMLKPSEDGTGERVIRLWHFTMHR
jgi:hypothetical protein